MNRFEIVFRKLEEAAETDVSIPKEAQYSEIRVISDESIAVEAIMRMSKEIAQQTQCACFTTA